MVEMNETINNLIEYTSLSINQPYAEFICNGKKTIEIRSWKTEYRGNILICSTKRPCYNNLLCGHALCLAELYKIDSFKPEHFEFTGINFNNPIYSKCTYAWHLKNIRKIKPFKVIGKQRLFQTYLKVAVSLL
jgi:hypothetical protein